MFRSSLIPTCSCRPLIFVLSNLMRADKPPRRILFFYQTGLARAGRRSVHGDRMSTSRVSSCISRRPRRGSEQSLQKLLVNFPHTCVGVVASCRRTSNLLQRFHLFPEPFWEVLSRGIAKRVTPLRRCENIRSLDRHLRQSRDRLSVWPNRLNRQRSERGCW